MPKVSVVIPTYNRTHFIIEAIQSVLDQTFQDFEIVVVDDGSTDNTKDVVDSFQDPRIKYIYQENRGVAAARNTGISASIGEYIAFLDSDDVLLKNALEKKVQVLDRYPEVAFSYGKANVMDENGHLLRLSKKKQEYFCVRKGSEQIRKFLIIYGNCIGGSGAMVRRRCLYEVGLFDSTFRHGSEDFDLWVRLAKRYAVAYIEQPVGVIVRRHPNRMSNARDLGEIEKSNSRILEGVFNDTKLGTVFSSQRPKAYFHLHLRLASDAYEGRDLKTARKYLFKALKIHPKGFFKGLWLPWMFRFGKTLMPYPVLRIAQRTKRCLHRFNSNLSLRSEILTGR
jgi:glycosyltransferase involved in cell wall biosynthesis